MKKIYTLLLALMMTGLGFGQTTIYSQDFETNLSGYSHTPSQTPSTDPGDQYFHRAEPSNNDIYESGGPYTNVTNSWLFVGSNPNTINSSSPGILSFGSIDVTGFSDLVVSADFGGVPNDWDAADELSMEYSWDNSTWSQLYSFSSPVTNDPLELENNATGGVNTANGAVLTYALQTITSNNFIGTGTTLYLRIVCDSGANYEAFGVDNIVLQGTAASSCTAPTTQASAYNTTSLGTTSATLNWTSGDGDEVLVLVKEGSAVDTDPTNGTAYTANTAFGSGDQIGTGNYAVYAGTTASSVSVTGLTAGTTYHVAVYEYNTTDTCYELAQLTGNFTTDCTTPTDVTGFTAVADNASVDLSWTNGSCFDEILVVAKATSAVTVTPTGDGTAYTANAAFGSGTDLGTSEYAVYKGTGTAVTVTGLTNGTTYHFTAFARKTTTWSTGASDSATPNLVEEAVAGDLIITEVSGDGSATGNDNGYMEIYNRSNKIINLDNIEVRYYNTNPNPPSQTVSLSGTLSVGGFIIVTQNATNYTTEFSDTADATGSSFFFNGGDDGCDVYHTTNGIIDQFNDNGSGQSPWTWSDNFTYHRNSSDSGAIEANWTQDGTETPRAKTNLYFWTGNTDSSWTAIGNWDEGAAPSSTTDVVITDQTNEPSITTTVEVAHFTIESNTDVVVEKTGNLEVSGNLNNNGSLSLESDSNEYSSLIIDGTSNGTINYDRHVNINGSGETGSNDLISAPLTGQAFSAFATANPNILSNGAGTLFLFGPFDKTTGDYVTYADTESATLDAGVGYRAASDDNDTFTFTGTANNGDIDATILNSGPQEEEWNLIGNPYPSYLNVQDFLNHERSPGVSNLSLFDTGTAAIYGYDGDATNGWTIYNLATTTAATVITPGQGFFVSSASASAILEFTPAMRSTGTSDDFIAGRQGELIYMTLQMSTASDSYSTDVYFNPNASLGFDIGFDAEFFGTAPPFSLYTLLVEENEGNPITLQAVNTDDLAGVTIPLGVNANQGEQLTFTITTLQLPETTEVYLDDMVANTSTLLNTSDYVLTPATTLSGDGRFFLRFFDTTLSTIDNNVDSLSISALNASKELVIFGQLQEDTMLDLYDIQGRKVLSTQLDGTSLENRIDVSAVSGGVYVVQVQNSTQQKSQKVIIK